MYSTVLIPTDGSIGADRAVAAGLDLAAQHEATVHALFVVDERRYGETPALSDVELHFERVEEDGQELLADIETRASQRGIDVQRAIRRGMPHETITAYADENDIDVIVMGRHGASQHPVPHLGSCTDRVLRTSSVPVLSA